MKFHLSLGLFSSNDIDSGSKLLLKTIAQQIETDKFKNILDIGCGTGVIGISLKKAFPEAEVTMHDRDALAVAFTKENSQANKIGSVIIENELALQGLENKQFDLLISNIPAKAGETVLEDFFRRSVNYITENGRAAVVIVSPLAAFAAETINKLGHELLFREDNHNYSVFHYRGKKSVNPEDDLSVYIRNSDSFRLKKTGYSLDTVYNIPDFDLPGYRITHAAEILDTCKIKGTGLFWNPGQGHIPVYTAVKKSNHFTNG